MRGFSLNREGVGEREFPVVEILKPHGFKAERVKRASSEYSNPRYNFTKDALGASFVHVCWLDLNRRTKNITPPNPFKWIGQKVR